MTLTVVRNAVKKVFKEHLALEAEYNGKTPHQMVVECVVSPRDDPGEWGGEGCVAIIYMEKGYLPGMEFSVWETEKWFDVSDEMNGLYVENVNGAVKAVYPG